MNLHENTDFGRKVFFLNPSSFLMDNIIPALFDKEYEIYTIGSYKHAKSVLKKFPDSICFICIDSVQDENQKVDELSPTGWYNFICSFEKDPILSTIFVGIISENATKPQQEFFQLNTQIPAGFIRLPCDTPQLIEIFAGILEINGAKGRRQYIRTNCSSDPNVQVRLPPEYQMSVKDISFAGLACSGSSETSDHFKVNTLIRDFDLSIHGKKYKCSGAVLMVSGREDITDLVIMFTKGSSLPFRTAIKDYIQQSMQNSIKTITESSPADTEDYSVQDAETVE
ncbi:MAG: hypothetical protein J6T84_00095 [Spirochaetaceae bacterium]|nr:hypothetical protein [Spirochaetaceae bacterium]